MKSLGGTGNIEIFKILLNSCYDAKDRLDYKKKSPMDYAKESGYAYLIEYAKTVTNVLFSREYQKVINRASKAIIERSSLNRKSDRIIASETLSTKDFKRIAVLGQGAYAEVMLVQRRGTGKGEGNPPIYYAMKRMQKL